MKLHIYSARCRNNERAIDFPDPHSIDMEEENEEILNDQIAQAVTNDHTPANFGGRTRSGGNFVLCDALALDLDNEDPDPENWATLEDVREAFPDVAGFAYRSRNYMQESHGNIAPRWHIVFAMNTVTDGERSRDMHKACNEVFPAFSFDERSMDPSRFFFGVVNPHIDIFYGTKTIDEFLLEKYRELFPEPASENEAQGIQFNRSTGSGSGEVYLEGTRNNTVHQKWLQWLTRHGDQGETANKKAFEEIASRCKPELPQKDLNALYNGGLKRFHEVIEKEPNYIPPDEYSAMLAAQDMKQADQDAEEVNAEALDEKFLRDPTDVRAGKEFAERNQDRARHSPEGWFYWTDNVVWSLNTEAVRALEHDHTEDLLEIASARVLAATIANNDAKKTENAAEVKRTGEELAAAKKVQKWVLSRRSTRSVNATLTEAEPYLQVKPDDLDADAELLNTPAGIVNLRTGEITDNDPFKLCTRITGVAPGDQGADIWETFLDQITDGNADMKKYLQEVSGMFLVGRVMLETLIIAYGPGGNGKSTYFNTLAKCMGSYAGGLASDVLILSNRGNNKPELAELRGRRLVICAELPDGCRLNSSMLKQICSTDNVRCEPKYCQPFSFRPSHSVALFSNYLPRVSASDSGTWSRLLVLPFTHTFRGTAGEVLNYSDYLFENAGPAVLAWMIRGAVDFLNQGGKITPPEVVQNATQVYQKENDIIAQFINDRCEQIADHMERASVLYGGFQAYCKSVGVRPKTIQDFRHELEDKGYEYHRGHDFNEVYGLRLIPWDFNENE